MINKNIATFAAILSSLISLTQLTVGITHGYVVTAVGYLSISIFLIVTSLYLAKTFERYLQNKTPVNGKGKAVFITGCDTGFGHHSALELNSRGFRIYAGCLFPDSSDSQSLATESKYPDNMILLPLDVTSDHSIDNCFEYVSKDLESTNHQLWALLNNAGIARIGPVEWGSYQWAVEEIINVNLIGPIKMTRKFLPLIRRSKGRLIFIASAAGRLAVPFLPLYSITKSAVIALAKGLYLDLKDYEVDVVSIEPTFARTNLTSRENKSALLKKVITETPKEVLSSYGQKLYKIMAASDHSLSLIQTRSMSFRVVEAICESVTTRRPRFQYFVAPFKIEMFFFLLNLLPDEVTLNLLNTGAWFTTKISQRYKEEENTLVGYYSSRIASGN